MILNCRTLAPIVSSSKPWNAQEIPDHTQHQLALLDLLDKAGDHLFPSWSPWRFWFEFQPTEAPGCAFYNTRRGSDKVTVGIVCWDAACTESAWRAAGQFRDHFIEVLPPSVQQFVAELGDAPPLPWHCTCPVPGIEQIIPLSQMEALVWNERELAAALVKKGSEALL